VLTRPRPRARGAGGGAASGAGGVQVRLAALVGAGREALAQSFRDVQLAAVSAADLWRLACTGKFKAAAGARRAPPARPAHARVRRGRRCGSLARACACPFGRRAGL
jgi:hypothetical protein